MENIRNLMQFYFITNSEISTHYHQNLELFYVLKGELEIRIDDHDFEMKNGDMLLINANKRHWVSGNDTLLAARFEIDFHLLAEYMESMQLLFWCNTVVDKNEAYSELKKILDKILLRYFEKDKKGTLYLNSLYYKAAYVLTSNFLIKSDDTKLNLFTSQDRARIWQIQNYVQANYQSQISLNDLSKKLFLSNAYLSKYVKRHFGLTFMEYLNNVRLFHAVDELLYTKKNMTRIALDNGFPTSAAFTKVFKEVHGEAPSEYRKNIQRQQSNSRYDLELTEEETEKIYQYLKNKRNIDEKDYNIEKVNEIDVKKEGRKLANTNKAICIGDAYMLLQSDVQKQLKDVKEASGIKYVRIWNIFSREECYNEKEGYNFRKIDLVLDFILQNDMKPYIELGEKLIVFMYNPEKYLKETKSKEIYNIETFQVMIGAFFTHLVNRYGIDEVETWYFEYWNDMNDRIDENRGMLSENGEYYTNFSIIYTILKGISQKIKIGGSGFVLGYETSKCKKILNIWNKKEIQPDFISVYSYQYIAIEEEGIRYGRKSIDPDYMKNQIEIFKKIMNEVGIGTKELHISEWNFTISNRNVMNDSCEQGAYLLKNCIDMNGNVQIMAYWHALDSYSDYYDSDSILNGDSGLVSRDGIRKPSFYAYAFMNRLLSQVLYQDSNSIVTTNQREHYVIAIHNFKKLSSQYVFTEENKITEDELEYYIENSDLLKMKFRLYNVKNGYYLIKTHYINKERGSVQDIWKRFGYCKNLINDEMRYLEKSSIPWMEMKTVSVQNNILEIDNMLLNQEIRLLDIQYQYTI